MSTFTENYNLIKPSEEDYYDVQDFNENMDAIDTQMMETETAIQTIDGKVGSPADTEEETIFGHLNRLEANSIKVIHAIKSVQRILFGVPIGTNKTDIPIENVDPDRTFVLYEPFYTENAVLSYSLSATNLTVNHPVYTHPSAISLGFWIIEFY